MKKETIFRAFIIAIGLSLIIVGVSMAQSITVSPTSVPLWGKLPATPKVSVSYKNFELVGLYGFRSMKDGIGKKEKKRLGLGVYKTVIKDQGTYKGLYLGLFYKPLNVSVKRFSVSGGVGVFHRRFPTKHGQRLAFTVGLEYKITNHLGVSWSHVSNGFGITNSLNPGVDNLSVKYHF